jgi:hypothetical protein
MSTGFQPQQGQQFPELTAQSHARLVEESQLEVGSIGFKTIFHWHRNGN